MERFRAARATANELSSEEREELKNLVDAEWQAAIERADDILQAAQSAQLG